MKKVLYLFTATVVLLFAVFYGIFKLTQNEIFQILYITFLTFSYHCVMRLVVGVGIDAIFKNRFNYKAKWFEAKFFEKKIYDFLRVKKWKSHIPAWSPESFDSKKHTYTEIARSMCQAELVHEVIIVLSFVPIIFSIEYGVPVVFICTSIFAAAVDSAFVIVQRYNRPRIIKIINKNLNRE